MPWWGVVLLVLFALPLVVYGGVVLLFFIADRSDEYDWREDVAFSFDEGASWTSRPIYFHNHHWLAKVLRAIAVTSYPEIFLKGEPWPRGAPGWEAHLPIVQARWIAHELGHCWRELQSGELRYAWVSAFDALIHRWKNRPSEREVEAMVPAIMSGTSTRVRWKNRLAYDNAGMPA